MTKDTVEDIAGRLREASKCIKYDLDHIRLLSEAYACMTQMQREHYERLQAMIAAGLQLRRLTTELEALRRELDDLRAIGPGATP
jgi:hypothetical protein